MLPANASVIHKATGEDAHALRPLAELDSRPPLAGAALIGDSRPAAAVTAASPATAQTRPRCAWISFRLGLAE